MSIQITHPTEKIGHIIEDLTFKQNFHHLISLQFFGLRKPKYCAIGAIGKSFGISDHDLFWNSSLPIKLIKEKLNLKDEDLKQRYHCPKCNAKRSMFGMLIHLNDHHMFNFKEIGKIFKQLHNYKVNPEEEGKLINIIQKLIKRKD